MSCNIPNCPKCEETPAQPWPGEEGYCPDCHMIVATENGLLIEHRGAFAQHFGNNDCIGSGTYPTEPDENMIDPWEDGRGPRRNDPNATGQSYGG